MSRFESEWKIFSKKSGVVNKVKENGLFVSVVSKDIADKAILWTMKMDLDVCSSSEQLWKYTTHFRRLSMYAPAFKEAQYDRKLDKLSFKVGILSFKWDFLVKFRRVESDSVKKLGFIVSEGPIRGLKGVFLIYDSEKCSKVGYFGVQRSPELSIPRFALAVAVEAMLKLSGLKLKRVFEQGVVDE